MKPAITREEVRAFRVRWKRFNSAETEELRAASPTDRLRQVASLMASAKELGWSEEPGEEAEVRERWTRLRSRYAG